MVNGTIV